MVSLTSDSPPQPSLRDIARELGISPATVSMALRDHPRISVSRREEVREAARRLGYVPDPMLASLGAYRQGRRVHRIEATLAWINRWPDPAALRRQHEFDAYWRGAHTAAARWGYRLEEFAVTGSLSMTRLGQILAARGVQGVLIPPHPSAVAWQGDGFDWSRFAMVRFGFSVTDLKVHAVGNDQMRSAELALTRMSALGYSRIGYVTYENFERVTGGNFRAGYERRMLALTKESRLSPLVLPEAIRAAFPVNWSQLEPWLKTWRPDAILTSDPGLLAALASLGTKVTGGIGLAATAVCDGGRIDAGIDQNAEEIGRIAATVLVDLLNRRELGIPQLCRRTLVEGRWIDGLSLPRRDLFCAALPLP